METLLILAIHIDDGLIAATDQRLINKLLRKLESKFDTTSCEVGTYLGLQIDRLTDGSIFVHQRIYTEKILKRFKMEEANAVAIPADPNHQMSTCVHVNGEKEAENTPYGEAVGSIIYLS